MTAWQTLDRYITQCVDNSRCDAQAWDDHFVLEADKMLKQFDKKDWETCDSEWVKRRDDWKYCFKSLLSDTELSRLSSTALDYYVQKHTPVWEDAYVGFSPLIEHEEDVSMEGIVRLIRRYPVVKLLNYAGHDETIQVEATTLKPLSENVRQVHIENLFEQALQRTGGLEDPEIRSDIPSIARAYVETFNKPFLAANSSRAEWNSWNPVTRETQDMLIVGMDRRHFRYVLAIVPD